MCYNLDVQCFLSEHLFYYPGMGEAMTTIHNVDENTITSLDKMETVEILIDALALNPIAIGKIVALLSDKTFTAVQKIPYLQLKHYIDGVKKAEENLAYGCKLSDKLFSVIQKNQIK